MVTPIVLLYDRTLWAPLAPPTPPMPKLLVTAIVELLRISRYYTVFEIYEGLARVISISFAMFPASLSGCGDLAKFF